MNSFHSVISGVILSLLTLSPIFANQTEQQPSFIELNRLQWQPLIHEGVPEGAKIAVLHGSLQAGPVEAVIRLPENYTFPAHSHSSSETYLWLTGDFSYVSENGIEKNMKAPAFISLPAHVPHALVCKDQPCLLYLRYPETFNMKIHSHSMSTSQR